MHKTKILYIHNGLSSFVKKDIQILSNEYELKIHYFKQTSKISLPLSFIKEFLFVIRHLFNAKSIIIQFAGYHSLIPVLIGKFSTIKTAIVLGGTDTVSFPSIQYGCFYNKYLRYFTGFSIRHASLLLPVSESLIEYKYNYQDKDFPKQGYRYHLKYKSTPPSKVIYNGYSAENWPFQLNKEKKSFITVAADLSTRFGPKLKGIDLILQISPKFPNCKFYIIGGDKLNMIVPDNVIKLGNMPHEKLVDVVGSKQFYLQLSMSEGFPNALCESMLLGCIPIVSDVGAMKMIVDDAGFILKRKNLDQLNDLIHEAFKSNHAILSKKARSRIVEHFSLDKRRNDLIETIKSCL